MKQKIIGYIAALILLSGSVMLMNYMVSSKEGAKKKALKEVVRSVRSLTYRPQEIHVDIPVSGKLLAYNRIEIYSEVGGRVLSNKGKFRKGNTYTRGQIMLQLDDTDMRTSLIALRSSFQSLLTQILADIKLDYPDNFTAWESYINTFDPEAPVRPLPKPGSGKEKQFLTVKNVYNQYYNILSQEEKLDKYTIRAPFSGTLSASSVQQGTIIRPGQKLGELIQPNRFELEVPVNVQDIKYLKNGQRVFLFSQDMEGKWQGRVRRIGESIDPKTQSIPVFLELTEKKLKEGMYLHGNIQGETLDNAYALPRKLFLKDHTVFAIENTRLKKVKPQVLRKTESSIIISGLEPGTTLLNESFVSAYEGMKVNVVE